MSVCLEYLQYCFCFCMGCKRTKPDDYFSESFENSYHEIIYERLQREGANHANHAVHRVPHIYQDRHGYDITQRNVIDRNREKENRIVRNMTLLDLDNYNSNSD